MNEADSLSDIVAILNQGKLKCIGSSLQLKSQYGDGYYLNVNVSDSAVESELVSLLNEKFKLQLLRKNAGRLTFVIHKVDQLRSIENFLKQFQKESRQIRSFAISPTTMEDVFLNVTKN